ncbi:hypothetical protein [Nocardia harenae]|uniref:hypothetical protein n=1 Tax=Nocardia harenae TaxID=358707 RepID=UPI0008298B48|nr:hypothetical protein [Nocardia harenae]
MIVTAIVIAVLGLLRRARSGGKPSRFAKNIALVWESVRLRARGIALSAVAVTLPVATLALTC